MLDPFLRLHCNGRRGSRERERLPSFAVQRDVPCLLSSTLPSGLVVFACSSYFLAVFPYAVTFYVRASKRRHLSSHPAPASKPQRRRPRNPAPRGVLFDLALPPPVMLRRNNSSRQPTLQPLRRPLSRSKSTGSLGRGPVQMLLSIDPQTAERDAHIAATLSYHRALQKSCGETTIVTRTLTSAPRSRQGCGARQATISRSDSVVSQPATTTEHGHALKREQSVRFAGPNAAPKRSLATRANGSRLPASSLGQASDSSLRPGWPQSCSDCSERRVTEASSPITSCSGTAEPLLDFSALEETLISLPSSYRKIRKSRSMLSRSNMGFGYHFNSNAPAGQRGSSPRTLCSSFRKEIELVSAHEQSRLKSTKSTSLLRQRRDHADSRENCRAQNDLAVQIAHGRFRQQIERNARLKSQSSLSFRHRFKHNVNFGLSKALHKPSNNSTTLSSSVSENTVVVSKQGGLRRSVRRVSQSLKNKLRGVLGYERPVKPGEDQTEEFAPDTELDGDDYPHVGEDLLSEEVSVSRVTARTPSLREFPSLQKLNSRQRSVETLKEDAQRVSDDRSRVTSWTNSISDNGGSQQTSGDWEKQRLSVIKENGMHAVPSSSNTTLLECRLGPSLTPSYTIDSQRVYSALMKRLEETKNKEQSEWGAGKRISGDGMTPSRCSSTDRIKQHSWSPPTIRCVQSEDDVFEDSKDFTPIEMKNTHRDSIIMGKRRPVSSVCGATHALDLANRTAKQSEGLDEETDPIQQQLPSGLSIPSCHLFPTNGTHRRALENTMQVCESLEPPEDLLSPETKLFHSLSEITLPTRHPTPIYDDVPQQVLSPGSVYSVGAKEQSPVCYNEIKFGDVPARNQIDDQQSGAMMFLNPWVNNPTPTCERNISVATSIGWKACLSADVFKTEIQASAPVDVDPLVGLFSKRRAGHVREKAEIESPGMSLAVDSSSKTPPSCATPSGPMETKVRTVPDRKENQRASIFSGRAVNENENSLEAPFNAKSSIAFGSNLCPMPSLPCVKSANRGGSDTAKAPIQRTRSLNTLAKSTPLSTEMLLRRQCRMRRRQGSRSPAYSSPGLTKALMRQFGNLKTGSPRTNHEFGDDRCPEYVERGLDGSETESEVSKTTKLGRGSQKKGSKTMVDLFLSSRCKPAPGRSKVQQDASSSPAFL